MPLTLPWLTAHVPTRCIPKGQAENAEFFSVIVRRGWQRDQETKFIMELGRGNVHCFH